MDIIRARTEREHNDRLRLAAQTLIKEGAAPPTSKASLGQDTLELLYRRASNPEFAADALKLLHELQTHQVELDMLYEQLQANEYEMTDELAHYRALYELAPVAYLIVANDGLIIESNDAGGILFGLSPLNLAEHAVTEFLVPASRAAITQMLRSLESPGSSASCVAELPGTPLHKDRTNKLLNSRRLTVNARRNTAGDTILLVISQIPEPDLATAQT